MSPIVLETYTSQGERLQATFLPDKGMNMVSFKKGNLEVIAQSTRNLFEERFAGLGALIGPHFHRRKAESLPKIADESLFPHIARVKAKGVADPFSHGIARYAPWKAEFTSTSIKGTLTGKDTWNGVPLAALEGQQFKMGFKADLKANGLFLDLSIVSDTDSLVGIHYYYDLPQGKGRVISEVKNAPEGINLPEVKHRMVFDLDKDVDFTFYPYPNPLEGHILLETEEYSLKTAYSCVCEENCWQLYHPAGSNFVCIEPISSQDPRHPNLSVSSIKIHLEIL
jgi:hypothetical protein